MTDIIINEAKRLALITREQVRLVNTQADLLEASIRNEEHEHSARAFIQDRVRQARPFGFRSNVIKFERRARHIPGLWRMS